MTPVYVRKPTLGLSGFVSKGDRRLLNPAALAADVSGNGNTSTGRKSSFSKLVCSLRAGTDLRSGRGRSATPSDGPGLVAAGLQAGTHLLLNRGVER